MVVVSRDSKLGTEGPTRWKTPSPHVAMCWATAIWLCLFKCLHNVLKEQLCPSGLRAGLDTPCLSCFASTGDLWGLAFFGLKNKIQKRSKGAQLMLWLEAADRPAWHHLSSGAALSNCTSQKWQLPQGFMRRFSFNFLCKPCCLGPLLGTQVSAMKRVHKPEGSCSKFLVAVNCGAGWVQVALLRHCFVHWCAPGPGGDYIMLFCCINVF